jgi:Arc/MetJ-type ribon-helix-helix transcriptional regulator
VYVKLPRRALGVIDRLIAGGVYLNRTHFVRRAVEELLEKEKGRGDADG